MDAVVRVQTEVFAVGEEIERLHRGLPQIGAVASFLGTVRSDDGVTGLELEHYPGMTEKALRRWVDEAAARWDLHAVTVIHRVGALRPAEPIVLVAVASAHRKDAFAACEFVMDALKTRAPFWKKEHTPSGSRWVEAKDSDEEAWAQWQ